MEVIAQAWGGDKKTDFRPLFPNLKELKHAELPEDDEEKEMIAAFDAAKAVLGGFGVGATLFEQR